MDQTISILLFFFVLSTPGESVSALNFITHGLNSIYLVLDIAFMSGAPIRIYHVIHTIAAALIYLVFTIIYDLTDSEYT